MPVRNRAAKLRALQPDQAGNGRVEAAFHEVKVNPPAIVQHTRGKFGAKRARAQTIAIALSKARKAGANIPVR